MKKLQDIKATFAENELLSIAATAFIKGGDGGTATEDEKRRQRPGGNGISTNRPTFTDGHDASAGIVKGF
jgi:hypothetical protein